MNIPPFIYDQAIRDLREGKRVTVTAKPGCGLPDDVPPGTTAVAFVEPESGWIKVKATLRRAEPEWAECVVHLLPIIGGRVIQEHEWVHRPAVLGLDFTRVYLGAEELLWQWELPRETPPAGDAGLWLVIAAAWGDPSSAKLMDEALRDWRQETVPPTAGREGSRR